MHVEHWGRWASLHGEGLKKNIPLLAEETRTNTLWYSRLSAPALCPRTVVTLEKTAALKPTEETLVRKTPRNAFFDQLSFRKAMDNDLLTQTLPKTRAWNLCDKDILTKKKKKKRIYFAIIKKEESDC